MIVWCFLIVENGDLKENKIFFCVDNSVFMWVLIFWYELKKKNIMCGWVIKNIFVDIFFIVM